jgi:hypothetical protein
MRSTSIRIVAFAAVASLPLLAQQPSPSPQPATSSPQATTPRQSSPEPSASQSGNPAQPVPSTHDAASPQLRPITGELVDKLDTKSAKAGDAVVVKTTEQATTANGIEIPKGSKITGHVIDVAPQGQSGENSRVTIQFDQAEIKGGKNLPIRSVIESVAPAGTTGAPDAASGPPAAPTPSASGAGTAGSGSHPATGSSTVASHSQPGAQPGTQPGAQPGAGGAEPAGGAPAPGTVVATKGNLAIRTTAIPGILLIGNVTGQPFSNAAGALLGAKQDVHLDGGTVMVVAIAAAPPTVGGR